MRSGLASLLILFALGISAQNKLSDRIYFGGGFGLSAGSDVTNISLSPQIGYKITERYSAGVGITYQYVKIRNFESSINNYGWSVFNRYNITRQFFAYGEYENLQFEFFTPDGSTSRRGFNSLLFGGGYSESLAGRATFSVAALYNVLYDPADRTQPYDSPWVVRAGVGIGIF